MFVLFHRLTWKPLHGTLGKIVHFKVWTVDFNGPLWIWFLFRTVLEDGLGLSGRQQFTLFSDDVFTWNPQNQNVMKLRNRVKCHCVSLDQIIFSSSWGLFFISLNFSGIFGCSVDVWGSVTCEYCEQHYTDTLKRTAGNDVNQTESSAPTHAARVTLRSLGSLVSVNECQFNCVNIAPDTFFRRFYF